MPGSDAIEVILNKRRPEGALFNYSGIRRGLEDLNAHLPAFNFVRNYLQKHLTRVHTVCYASLGRITHSMLKIRMRTLWI